MVNTLLNFIHNVSNAAPRTERELSIALAIHHIIAEKRDFITIDQAKQILKDYIYLDENQYSKVVRDNHQRVMERVDWAKVIYQSLTDEIHLKAHSIIAKEKHVRL